jgi:hypothetical protein
MTESPSQKIQLLLQDKNDQAGKKMTEYKKGNITKEKLNTELKKLNARYFLDSQPLGAFETSPETQLRTAKTQTTKLFNKTLKTNPKLVEEMTKNLNILVKPDQVRLARIGCPGKGKADGGRIGFSNGQNLTSCATKGVEKLRGDPGKLSPGDQANLRALTKSVKAINFLKGVLGPAAILGEVVFEGGAAANKFMEGMPLKQALGESYLNYALGPKLKIDVEAERAKEMVKGEEYAMAERGRRKAPFMAQSVQADELRRKKAMKKMEEVYPTSSESDINLGLQNAGMTQQETGMTYPEIQDYIKREDQMQAIAEAGGVSKMATGGLANLMKKYYD